MNEFKVVLVTAGLGSLEFENAAKRIIGTLFPMYPFSNSISLTSANLKEYCPEIAEDFKSQLKTSVKGFAYMSWKAEITRNVLRGDFGKADGILWVDAGCEIFDSYWTRRKLKSLINKLRIENRLIFSLDTPENEYTKRDVLLYFGENFLIDNSAQIQTTFFGLSGGVGKIISAAWFDAIKGNLRSVDDSISKGGELPNFRRHTTDQSVFSLACKSEGLLVNLRPLRSGARGLLSQLSALRDPIWASRNRSGVSIIQPIFLKVGHASIALSNVIERIIFHFRN